MRSHAASSLPHIRYLVLPLESKVESVRAHNETSVCSSLKKAMNITPIKRSVNSETVFLKEWRNFPGWLKKPKFSDLLETAHTLI